MCRLYAGEMHLAANSVKHQVLVRLMDAGRQIAEDRFHMQWTQSSSGESKVTERATRRVCSPREHRPREQQEEGEAQPEPQPGVEPADRGSGRSSGHMSRIMHSLARKEPDFVGCVGFTVVKAGRVHLTHDSSGTV